MNLHGVISKRLPGAPSIAAVGGLTGLLSLVALRGCGGGGYTAPQTRWNAFYEFTPIPFLRFRAGCRAIAESRGAIPRTVSSPLSKCMPSFRVPIGVSRI